MTPKDLAAWHLVKSSLHLRIDIPYFRARQVWWAAVGLNIGFEEDGKSEKFSRPVLVVRKFNAQFFLGVPLSTTAKTGRYYIPVTLEGNQRKVLVSQIRAFDSRRLLEAIGPISKEDFSLVCQELRGLIPNERAL